MCFRTSVDSSGYSCSTANRRKCLLSSPSSSSSSSPPAFFFQSPPQLQQCLACLFLILSLLTGLTEVSSANAAGGWQGQETGGDQSERVLFASSSSSYYSSLQNASASYSVYRVLPEWSIHQKGSSSSSSFSSSTIKPVSLLQKSTTTTTISTTKTTDIVGGGGGDIGPWPWAPAPIRHWWAQHHHKRSAPTSTSSSGSGKSNGNGSGNGNGNGGDDADEVGQQQHHEQNQQCLRHLEYMPADSVLHFHQGKQFAEKLCNATSIDKRVKMLLSTSPCDLHKVCQVLSPQDLQEISSEPLVCKEAVRRWWKKFHTINKAILDFEKIFTTSLDIDQYSVMFNVQRCKVRRCKKRKKGQG